MVTFQVNFLLLLLFLLWPYSLEVILLEAWLIRLNLPHSTKTGLKHNIGSVTNIEKSSFVQRRNGGNELQNRFSFWFFMFHIRYLFTLTSASLFNWGNPVLFMVHNILWTMTHSGGNGPKNFGIPLLNNWLEGREDSSFYNPSSYLKKICLYYLWKNLLMEIRRSDKKTNHSFLDDRDWRDWRLDLGLHSLGQWQTASSQSGGRYSLYLAVEWGMGTCTDSKEAFILEKVWQDQQHLDFLVLSESSNRGIPRGS